MAVNSFSLTQTVLRIDYEDPAGGFAGWFLHVVHSGSALFTTSGFPPSVSLVSGLTGPVAYYVSGSGGVGGPDNNSQVALDFRNEVRERFERMFGSAGLVKWTATLIEDVTPAVIDDDYDGS